MEYIEVDRSKTFFASEFIADYYSNKLADFHTYKPDISEVHNAIEAKTSFSQEKRNSLVTVLKSQYAKSGIELNESLANTINSLSLSNAFTVTTGQQIHIGLGPLYVLYKALDVLAITKELKQESPKNNFVPIFWMASEDHDLAEISEIDIFGKTIRWETDQKGPVGRMNTDGLTALFAQIQENFNWSPAQNEFLENCKHIYSISANLSIAFRKLLHTYFADTGLLILDADDPMLKQSFKPVLEDEIAHRNIAALEATTKSLVNAGYEKQLVVRACNLFDMSSGDRIKVLSGLDPNITPYDLSPNAALRPLYQEWILPNLVYVGGPSELKYWMQLKGLFDNYDMPIPLLHLRTSIVIVPAKQIKIVPKNEVLDLFDSIENIGKKQSAAFNELSDKLEKKFEDIQNSIVAYSNLTTENFTDFSITGKLSKITPKFLEIKELVDERLTSKIADDVGLNKLLRIKNKYFNAESIQERNAHFIAFADVALELVKCIDSQFGFRKSQKIAVIII